MLLIGHDGSPAPVQLRPCLEVRLWCVPLSPLLWRRVDALPLVCHTYCISRRRHNLKPQMTITAAVKYTALRNGTRHRYIVTLSNGTVAKREGVRTYNYLAVPTDRSGSTTNGSQELQPLVRMCGGSTKTVIVETATGRVIDCAKLPKHNVERRAKAQATKEAAQQKRLQEFCRKLPSKCSASSTSPSICSVAG